MKTIEEVLKTNSHGLFYGDRILLPFAVNIMKAVVENDIITDFSDRNKGASYNITEDYTEIYFYDYKDLEEVVTEYETIKLIVIEKGKDLFDMNNHIKLVLRLGEHHKLLISELDKDALFIE